MYFMSEKFVRFTSIDDIEMCGILFEPDKKTKKIVIHVHGQAGNFFENRFISYLKDLFCAKGYSYVSFNNRGYGYFSDLLKGNSKTIKGGAAYEIFEECLFDIEGVLKYLSSLGYNEFILEGHSYGCNKVVYAYNILKDKYNITDIILLSPCDIYQELHYVVKNYDAFLEKNAAYCKEGRELEFIPSGLFPMEFTAKTVINNFSNGVNSDIFRYRDSSYQSFLLKNISIPVHIIIGEKDECVFTSDKNTIEKFLKSNIKRLDINYIANSKHIFKGQEKSLVAIMGELL